MPRRKIIVIDFVPKVVPPWSGALRVDKPEFTIDRRAGLSKDESHGQASTYSVAFIRQVVQEYLAGETPAWAVEASRRFSKT